MSDYDNSRQRHSTRSGRYITQSSGYRAFIPEPLPHLSDINLADILPHLIKAQDAIGRLDGVAGNLPNPEMLILMYIRAEAVLSSQIEGTQASLEDVLRAESKMQSVDDAPDVQEVINYIHALNYGLERRNDLPISLRLIREIHSKLMSGVRGKNLDPGEFRRSQNWIGAIGATLQTASFVPPPVAEMYSALDDFEKFIYDENTHLPNLVKIGLLHAQFETIHPFLDGNGRTGRLLITFLLCHYNLLSQPILYLSYYFKLNRIEYYNRLQAIRDKDDWEGWLKFFLDGINIVASDATQKTRTLQNIKEENHKLISQLGIRSSKGIVVIEHLYKHPYVNVRKVEEITASSYASANKLVNSLVEIGILYPFNTKQRDKIFYHKRYIEVFSI